MLHLRFVDVVAHEVDVDVGSCAVIHVNGRKRMTTVAF